MNEIWLYVDHLFVNRVNTPEIIDLKEEIYGNLLARYEDYRASGMTREQAIEQTLASITSVDELLAEVGRGRR